MPRYGLIWLEIAREQYASRPAATRKQLDERIEQLLESPRRQSRSDYDEATDTLQRRSSSSAGTADKLVTRTATVLEG